MLYISIMKEKLNNTNVIKNFSYDQNEILYNIMNLHNNGEPFECDMTASKLKFYNCSKKYPVPEPKILMDVYPQRDDIIKIEPFHPLPLEDNSISSIVIDLPFVVSPPNAPSAKSNKEGASFIFRRFSGFYPVCELYMNYQYWIKEAYRVLKPEGICVFKCQNTVSGGINHFVEEYSFMCAVKDGFYVKDQFILGAKARLISASKIKNQEHARKYTSTFWIFKKTDKYKSKVNYFDMMEGKYYMPKNYTKPDIIY